GQEFTEAPGGDVEGLGGGVDFGDPGRSGPDGEVAVAQAGGRLGEGPDGLAEAPGLAPGQGAGGGQRGEGQGGHGEPGPVDAGVDHPAGDGGPDDGEDLFVAGEGHGDDQGARRVAGADVAA